MFLVRLPTRRPKTNIKTAAPLALFTGSGHGGFLSAVVPFCSKERRSCRCELQEPRVLALPKLRKNKTAYEGGCCGR